MFDDPALLHVNAGKGFSAAACGDTAFGNFASKTTGGGAYTCQNK